MNKQAIVERIIRKRYERYDMLSPTSIDVVAREIDFYLTAAGYFDLLEAATDLIKQHRAMRQDKTCVFKRCECGNLINLNVRYSDKCVYCRIEEILRKAGVNVE